jgi:hypothetical protein
LGFWVWKDTIWQPWLPSVVANFKAEFVFPPNWKHWKMLKLMQFWDATKMDLHSQPGLPDGIFSNQKSWFRRVLQWKMLYGRLVNFTAIWYSMWLFGIFYGYWV